MAQKPKEKDTKLSKYCKKHMKGFIYVRNPIYQKSFGKFRMQS